VFGDVKQVIDQHALYMLSQGTGCFCDHSLKQQAVQFPMSDDFHIHEPACATQIERIDRFPGRWHRDAD
jgi:hypothetical protein